MKTKEERILSNKLIQAIIRQNEGISLKEAVSIYKDMRMRVMVDWEDPEEVLLDEGFEADYVIDLISI